MKTTVRIVSFVLLAVMLMSLAVMPATAVGKTAEKISEQYQYVTKFATVNIDESAFAASDRCFVIDNVVYNSAGKKLSEIPLEGNDGVINLVIELDGRYAYALCAWPEDEEVVYGVRLFNAMTGELLADRYEKFYTDDENGYLSIDGKSTIAGTMDRVTVGNFPCAYAINLGDGMYLFVSHDEAESETGIDFTKSHEYYDAKTGRTFASKSSYIPVSFSEETELGIAVNSDGEMIFCDRDINKVTDGVYSYIEYLGDGIYQAENESGVFILDASANVLCTIPQSEEGYEYVCGVYTSYVITVDENAAYRIYDRENYTADGNTYGWYRQIDDNTFTVGDGTYDPASDTPDLIYNADGSVTETALNCLSPVKGAKYLLDFNYETEAETLYDRELELVRILDDDYENIYLLDHDDLIMAEKKDGSIGFVNYEDEVVIPFDYDTETIVYTQRFGNGDLLVSLGYTVDGVNYCDIYLLNYYITPFKDVGEKSWFLEAVEFVNSKGLMTGKSETVFAPNEQMTRAQLVTVLYRMAGSPEVEFASKFTDVKESKWFADAVIWAAENGIIEGFHGGIFAPDDPVTRDQLAAILYRYTDFSGGDISVEGSFDAFVDGSSVQKWAEPALKWAVGIGIIRGKPVDNSSRDAIAPKEYTTRAEVATVLKRFLTE